MEEQYIEANGIKLHTMITGTGPSLILLHGFPEFWYGWKNLILALKDEFKLVVPDLRGYNLSDKPEGVDQYHINVLVEDIHQLSKNLDLGKFTLIGHDWGGFISWAFAEKHPELLNKLIILNSPNPAIFQKHLLIYPAQQKASAYISRFAASSNADNLMKDNCQLLRNTIFGTASNKEGYSEEDVNKYLKAWNQPGAVWSGVKYYKANRDFSDLTGVIKVPTLVLWGMKDIFVLSSSLDDLPDYVEDLKIVTNEHASHWLVNDDIDFVASNIREFVRE
ncbi:MAG: alpha/beta fold hydrolase [Promethearchaeota archaeon]